MDAPDRWLESAFSEMRAEDRSEAPDFEELVGRTAGAGVADGPLGTATASPRLRPRARWMAWTTGLAAATVGALLLVRSHASSRRFEATLERAASETRLGSWTGPSDFLLDVPGRELYGSVPTITVGWGGLNAALDSIPHERERRN
jgi:hypothetical protein